MKKNVLLIPHIKVHNANALSSPYTIGFPAMTAWLGAVHAMQRLLNQDGFKKVMFQSVGVVCHTLDLQTYKGKGDYVRSIIGSGNPLDKDGKRSAFIEEARCHLDVSLLIEYEDLPKKDEIAAAQHLTTLIHSKMKMAAGDILSFDPLQFFPVMNNEALRQVTRKLMPGYAIIERRELMETTMQEGEDAIDAILDYLKVMHRSEKDDQGHVTWHSHKKTSGWLVPIATGFHGITPLEKAQNQRDPDIPHRFAESIVTLGEFVMPYRINDLDDMLWHYHTDLENNLYLCQQNNRKKY